MQAGLLALPVAVGVTAAACREVVLYRVTPTVSVNQLLVHADNGPVHVFCDREWRPRWPRLMNLPRKRVRVTFELVGMGRPKESVGYVEEDMSTPVRVFGREMQRRRDWIAPRLTAEAKQRLIAEAIDVVRDAIDGRHRIRASFGKKLEGETAIPAWWKETYY